RRHGPYIGIVGNSTLEPMPAGKPQVSPQRADISSGATQANDLEKGLPVILTQPKMAKTASRAEGAHLTAAGLVEVLRKLAIAPSLAILLVGGLTLRAELPAGIGLLLIAAAFVGAWHLPRCDYRLFALH